MYKEPIKKSPKELKLEEELNKLQNRHFSLMDDAMYNLRRYEEYKAEANKLDDEINKKFNELYQLNPDTDYELDY